MGTFTGKSTVSSICARRRYTPTIEDTKKQPPPPYLPVRPYVNIKGIRVMIRTTWSLLARTTFPCAMFQNDPVSNAKPVNAPANISTRQILVRTEQIKNMKLRMLMKRRKKPPMAQMLA
jgi:hypothetical protein